MLRTSAYRNSRRGRVYYFVTGIMLIALTSRGVRAGIHDQGIHDQGIHDQGRGIHTGWLEGPKLEGRLVADGDRAPISLTINGFFGDRIDGIVRDGDRAVSVRLAPSDLVGLQWTSPVCPAGRACFDARYRIVSAVRDRSKNTMPDHSDNRDVWLYQVEFIDSADPRSERWATACPASSGRRGLFVNGRWGDNGSWHPGGYTFSCPSGVIAKCVRGWGYKPWARLPAGSQSSDGTAREIDLLPLHLACVRAARADYCGDGTSHTRNGTLIDMFDRHGLNVPEDELNFRDESAFGIAGADWVDRPRWPTGERKGERWTFPTCQRPVAISGSERTRSLIYVRSATLLEKR